MTQVDIYKEVAFERTDKNGRIQRRYYQYHDTPFGRKMYEKGYTAAQVAKELGCKESTVSQWHVGKWQPRVVYLEPLCKMFDCSAAELFDSVKVKSSGPNKKVTPKKGEKVQQAPSESVDVWFFCVRVKKGGNG